MNREDVASARARFYRDAGFRPGERIRNTDTLPGTERRWAIPAGTTRKMSPVRSPATILRADTPPNVDGRVRLTGVASVTDTPYEMWDWTGPYDEVISRRAFDKTLAALPDVSFLANHGQGGGLTMARTVTGTLDLSMVDSGLRAVAYVDPLRHDVNDLVRSIEGGEITEMSFAFMLVAGIWSDDYTQFTITEVDIDRGDVSAVNFGANPYTSIAARTTAADKVSLADAEKLLARWRFEDQLGRLAD